MLDVVRKGWGTAGRFLSPQVLVLCWGTCKSCWVEDLRQVVRGSEEQSHAQRWMWREWWWSWLSDLQQVSQWRYVRIEWCGLASSILKQVLLLSFLFFVLLQMPCLGHHIGDGCNYCPIGMLQMHEQESQLWSCLEERVLPIRLCAMEVLRHMMLMCACRVKCPSLTMRLSRTEGDSLSWARWVIMVRLFTRFKVGWDMKYFHLVVIENKMVVVHPVLDVLQAK